MDLQEKLKDALIKRALGYDYEERRMIVKNGNGAEKVEVTRKHMPPDLSAIKCIQLLISAGEWEC